MKKKRGKKKPVSEKKKKVFFLFNNKVAPLVLSCVFLALAIALAFVSTGNAVNASITGNANAIDNEVTGGWVNAVNWLNLPEPLTWRELIVFIITLAILFAILYDILTLVSLFSNWVSAVIAVGMSIIGSLIGVVRIISTWFITIGSVVGIAAGFLEIIVSIVIFIGLIFASTPLAKFAAKRKGQKEYIKAIGSSSQAGAAIKGLREIQKEFRKP